MDDKQEEIGTYRVNTSGASDWLRSPDSAAIGVGELQRRTNINAYPVEEVSEHKTYRSAHSRKRGGRPRRRCALCEGGGRTARRQTSQSTLLDPLEVPCDPICLGNQRAHQPGIRAILDDPAVPVEVSRDGFAVSGDHGHAIAVRALGETDVTGGLTVGGGGGIGKGDRRIALAGSRGRESKRWEEGGEKDERCAGELHYGDDYEM